VIGVLPRPASGSKPLFFILGCVIAAVAFIGVFVVGSLAAGGGAGLKKVDLVAAARDIQPREVIKPGDLQILSLPAASVPPGARFRSADVAGATALVQILKGQPVTTNVTAASPDQIAEPGPAFLPIPKGWVAVTIPTNEQQGVAGYIAAGDYLNIVVTLGTAQFGAPQPKTVTRTVFNDVHVIRVGPQNGALSRDGQRAGLTSSLTIVVSQCDAGYLNWFVANAAFRYELRSYEDYGSAPPAADPTCPASPSGIGPVQVEARYGFTRI
jgi:pilus assembly protein CpaB